LRRKENPSPQNAAISMQFLFQRLIQGNFKLNFVIIFLKFKLFSQENPCQHPVIIFRNVTFDDLMALVDFMYNGEVNVEQEQLASFLNTAELLQVQGLTNSSKDQEKSKKTAKEVAPY